MSTVDDVAAAILSRTGEVTTWKLQKLVYYSQAWNLAQTGRVLFSDEIEAWQQGPVVRHLYNQHRHRNRVGSWPKGNLYNLTKEQRQVILWVLDRYSKFSAETLSEMTHAEAPWFVAREFLPPEAPSSNVIDPGYMRHFYERQAASPDRAVSQAIANTALEGVEVGADWEEELRRAAEGETSIEELIAREIDKYKS